MNICCVLCDCYYRSSSSTTTTMLIVKLFIVCILVGIVHSDKWKCNTADVKEMDDIVSLAFTVGRKDRRFPESVPEMREYCRDQKKYIQRMEAYKDQCLKEASKQIVSVILYSAKTLFNNHCKNMKSKRTQQFLSAASCANKNSDAYNQCQIDYIDILYELRSFKPAQNKEIIIQLCCGYLDSLDCIHKAGVKAKCQEKHIESNMELMRSYFDGAANSLCGEYTEHNDKCDSVPRIKTNDNKNRPKSVFFPAIDVLVNL